jgi:ClpP class serine protease
VANPNPAKAHKLVEKELSRRLATIEKKLDADALTYFGPIFNGTDDVIRDGVEARVQKRAKLAVILETGGGYITVVERIVTVFRRYYQVVDFVIPDHAMSAGTVLALSGDAIHMDYYSVLGPIDPQVQKAGSRGFLPALVLRQVLILG